MTRTSTFVIAISSFCFIIFLIDFVSLKTPIDEKFLLKLLMNSSVKAEKSSVKLKYFLIQNRKICAITYFASKTKH